MTESKNKSKERDWLKIIFWIMTIEVYSGIIIRQFTGFGGMGMGPISIIIGLIFGFTFATYLMSINILTWLGLAVAYSIKRRKDIRVEKAATTNK